MPDQSALTREGLALVLLDRILAEEGRTAGADRVYTLSLLRDILAVIDGGRSPENTEAQVVSITSGHPSQGG